ncbi:carbon storage regulator [Pseudomonas endophytica]|uniref:carbon storage regulator n=1 Tax=Pseudomonas endophytica TaxID=1563157 RepID=UPI0009E8F04D
MGESIRIGDDISIKIKGISGDKAILCVGAPKQIMIHREELYHRFKSCNPSTISPLQNSELYGSVK